MITVSVTDRILSLKCYHSKTDPIMWQTGKVTSLFVSFQVMFQEMTNTRTLVTVGFY